MARMIPLRCLSCLLALAVLATGCGNSGTGRAETWNSYYYGEVPVREGNIKYLSSEDADDAYSLPRGYGHEEYGLRSSRQHIPSHNLIPANPH